MDENQVNPNHIVASQPPETPRIKKLNNKIVLFVGLISLLIFSFLVTTAAFIYFGDKEVVEENEMPIEREDAVEVIDEPTPTPPPFYEMTIPYLRARDYKSRLSELNEYQSNSNYTSYLTSYDSDGLRVNALLTIPEGEEPEGGWPAIIFVHGYIPPQNYSTTSNYADYVDYLARNDFVVFKIDLRGHGDSEGEAGGAYYSSDYIVDVLNANAALAASDFVHPARIGFWGHSMAGNVVSRAMASAPSTPAISIWAGAVYTYEDFSEFQIDDNSYQPPPDDSERRRERDELFDLYGRFDPNSDFWRRVPMTNYLDAIGGAIQINHAVNDDVVDIGYSRNFAAILENNSIEYEFNEYTSGGHNITGSAFNQAMQDTVRFFEEYL